ncbi:MULTISPECIES: SpoIIE family protein phosphatase [Streptomyces]|uniref:SpoIIE family protein phosphatase n=1 Tax=Streptomyces TaxID=1883 RepID=UPI001BF12572|nr:SpoIIE family protein phosphatase [Streptomyces sp. EAS-AB2608]BCM64863.1 putative magnesium or manganese-dependent protein phosphatase [Streptomyces sp. EAS-AB2608]
MVTTSRIAPGPDHRGDPLCITRAAVVTLDGRKRVTGWSPRAEKLLGYHANEMIGQPIGRLSARAEGANEDWLGRQWDGGTPGHTVLRHRSGHFLRTATSLYQLPARVAGTAFLLLLADAQEHAEWQLRQAMLHGLAAESPVALTIYGPDLRVAWANAAARRELPGEFTQYLGRSESELYPGSQVLSAEHPPSVTQLMSEVLATGRTVVDLRYRGRTLADPDREHVWSLSYYRLRDAAGQTLGVCEESVDVTDLYRAQHRLALLNEAAVLIGSTLDLGRTVEEFAEVLVPEVADFIAVDLLGAVLDGREPDVRSADRTGDMRRAVHRSVREDLPEVVVPQGCTVGYAEGSPQWQCLASGHPVLNDVLTLSSPWLVGDAERSSRMRELGIHSHMVVPLRARGVTMGVATLMRWRNPESFMPEDLLLVEELAARAAVCIDNARRFTREHHSALMLQRSLLPHDLPAHTAVEAAYRYLPADTEVGVGGDWFDVLPLACARVGLVVGDVVGHGLRAAATMGRLRTAVHTLADLDLPPDELLAHLDDLVQRLAEEAETAHPFAAEGVVGATCLYGVYDSVTRRATFASAGHPPPVLAHRNKPVESCDVPTGPPLGVGGMPFESAEIDIPDDCVLALYTDGLIMASDRDADTGLARLSFALAHPERPLEEITGTMERILLSDHPADDVAFLVARPRPLPADCVASWELAFEPETAGRARSLASERLAQWRLEDLTFSVELIVSELVTNAIRHARNPVSLRLIRTENRLICAVSDGSSTSPHMRRARLGEEGGRGLFLVAQFAARWGTRHTADGKTIWAEMPAPAAETALPPAGATPESSAPGPPRQSTGT